MIGRGLLAQALVLIAFGILLGVSASLEPDKATPNTPEIASATATKRLGWSSGTSSEQEVEPTPLRADFSDISRLVIPELGINAPLEKKGIDTSSKMEDPSTAEVVSWYDLTPTIDSGFNIVLAGHFTVGGEPAVFWELKTLSVGDQIILKVGYRQLVYSIVTSEVYPANVGMNDLIGPTANESLTIITCDGNYLPQSDDYDQRRVVRAERIEG
jgi:LPXTG-site transpeptidase (sortase) family protein